MTGAFLAQKAGLSTVVVEKTALLGGTSAYSGGACWLPGQRGAAAGRHPRLDRVGARDYLAAILEDADAGRRSRRSCGTRPSWSPSSRPTRRSTSSGCRSRSTTTRPAGCPFGRSIQPTNVKRGDLPPRVGDAGAPAGRARPGRRGRPQHPQRRPVADRPAAATVPARRRRRSAPTCRSPGWSPTATGAWSASPR